MHSEKIIYFVHLTLPIPYARAANGTAASRRAPLWGLVSCLALAGAGRVARSEEHPAGEVSGAEAPLTEEEIAEMTLSETVVRETRVQLSAGGTRVTREDVEKAHPVSADEMLELVPGVHIVQHGAEGKGHQIFLQGFDAAHGSDVEGLLEGISLNEPSHVHGQGYLDLYGIIPEVVSEMAVVKGPFLPWQGDFAVSGSLRFDLGVPEELRPGFVSAEGTHRGKMRSVAVTAPEGADDQTFFAFDLVRDAGFGPDREATRGAFLGQYRKDFGRHGAVTFLASLQSARFESPETLRLSDVEDGKKDFWGAYGPAGHGLSDRAMARLSYRYERDGRDVEVAVFGIARDFFLEENFTGRLLYPEHGDLGKQAHQAGAGGFTTAIEKTIPLTIPAELYLGMGWRFDGLRQQEHQLDLSRRPWQTNRDIDSAIHQTYAYAGVRLSPTRWLTVLPSLRVAAVAIDMRDRLRKGKADSAEIAALPRLAASFPIRPEVTLFADYGRGYRTPESRAVAAPPQDTIEDERLSRYTGGAPEITIVDSVQTGIELKPVRPVRMSLFGFATFLDREMVFDHVSNINVAMDGTRRWGVTFDGAYQPLRWLELGADVTWTDARFNHSGHRVPGVPIWMGTARANLGKARGPKGGASLLWCGTRPLAHGAEVKGYPRLDASVGWRFGRADLTVMVMNVLNQKIMEGVYHFASWFDEEEQRSLIPSIHYAAGEPITARFLVTVYL